MDVVRFMDELTGHDLLAWKASLGTGIVALAGLQVALGARFWTGRGLPLDAKLAVRLHRWNGRLLLVLSLVIGDACLFGPAGPTSPLRLLLHSIFGATLFALVFAKLLVIRVLRGADRVAPHLGVALFVNYVAIWFVTVGDYVTDATTDPPPGGALRAWAFVTGSTALVLGAVGIVALARRAPRGGTDTPAADGALA